MPWAALVRELEPFYPKGEGRGRPPIGKRAIQYIQMAFFDKQDGEPLLDSDNFSDTGGMGLIIT